MHKNQITFFACDNGDASLFETNGITIMTDINYRVSEIEKDASLDFAPKIRKACEDDRLNIFILTHPDEDHLRGFDEVFHVGKPEDREDDPDEGDVRILVDEIWCSSYAVDPNYQTDESKPVLDEIARRKGLQETSEGKEDGNRLRVLQANDKGKVDDLTYRVLAPTPSEADIPKDEDDPKKHSSNPSSLVIQWTVMVGGRASKVVLGGDSTVEVWERIDEEYPDEYIEWHILLAPHHCSRHTMGRTLIKDGKEVFEWSEKAVAGLKHPTTTRAHVVSSSRKFAEKHPPHPDARKRYYSILASGGKIDETVSKRFLITAGKNGQKPKDITFRFTSSGPTLAAIAVTSTISTPSSAGGGGYGEV